jgi:flagellar biosynthesis/type III secretory pathway chaperone
MGDGPTGDHALDNINGGHERVQCKSTGRVWCQDTRDLNLERRDICEEKQSIDQSALCMLKMQQGMHAYVA